MLLRWIAIAIAIATGTLTCAGVSENEFSGYKGPVNRCDADEDCPQGTCAPDLSICAVDPPGGETTYFAKVLPGSDVETIAQIFPVDPQAAAHSFDLGLPVQVDGRIHPEGQTNSPLHGRVIFTDLVNRLPGHPAHISVYASTGVSIQDLYLLPSRYRVMVVSDADAASGVPVHYFDNIAIDAEGDVVDATTGEETDLAVPLAVSTVEGRVTQGGLAAVGLEVTALDPSTGRIVSSSDLTHCEGDGDNLECGLFFLGLNPTAALFSLVISRPGIPHHPVFTVPGFYAPSAGGTLDLRDDDRLSLDTLGSPIRYRAIVEKPTITPDGETSLDPAPGAFVILRSVDDSVAGGAVERLVSTNEDGEIEEADGMVGVHLFPGQYTIVIIPGNVPSGSLVDYTAASPPDVIPISGLDEIGPQGFILETRAYAEGNVWGDGDGVPFATVNAQPCQNPPLGARNAFSSAETDGGFHIWLDETCYFVVAEAPVASNYGWGEALWQVGAQEDFDLSLQIPFVMRGNVVVGGTVAGGGSIIEWYRLVQETAVLVGRAAADETGAFTALLSPPP